MKCKHIKSLMCVLLFFLIPTSTFASKEDLLQDRKNLSDQQTQEIERKSALEAAIYTGIKDDIEKVDEKIESLENKIQNEESKNDSLIIVLGIIVALIDIFFIGLFIAARNAYKKKITEIQSLMVDRAYGAADQRLTELVSSKESQLEERNREFLKRIEEKNFQYMQITSLSVSGNYDEALDEAGWKGDYKTFIDEPDAYQRLLISSLARSRSSRKENSNLAAWQWSRQLVQKAQSYRNIECMLRNGITMKHFEEAIAEYDRFSSQLTPEERDLCEPILFVAIRRARKPGNYETYTARLMEIARKHRYNADMKMVTNFAAFYRDEGQLEEAERLMAHNIKRLTGITPTEDGWERLFNTHIANCVDQGNPIAAINQTKTLLSNSKRPDNLFTCVRVAWLLDEGNPEKEEIIRAAESILSKGNISEGDDGTIKSKALILEIRGRKDEAETLLKNAIDTAIQKQDKYSENNLYYFRSLLAQILLSRGDTVSVDKAIEVLKENVLKDEIGEIQFLMARAQAIKKNHAYMEHYLEGAAKTKRKWIVIAGKDKLLKELGQVSSLLSKYSLLESNKET